MFFFNLSIISSSFQISICRSVRLHIIIWPDKLQEQPQQCKLLWLFAALRTPAIGGGSFFWSLPGSREFLSLPLTQSGYNGNAGGVQRARCPRHPSRYGRRSRSGSYRANTRGLVAAPRAQRLNARRRRRRPRRSTSRDRAANRSSHSRPPCPRPSAPGPDAGVPT